MDLHEYEPVESALRSTNGWANKHVDYDLATGTGTYFISAIDAYLAEIAPRSAEIATSYVVFPDAGAHRRFASMVSRHGLPPSNVLWIEKTRVGTAIEQAPRPMRARLNTHSVHSCHVDAHRARATWTERRAAPRGRRRHRPSHVRYAVIVPAARV